VPGSFFAGEILDIDGVTGVLISSAWTTAWLAGQAMGGKRAGEVGRWRMKRISLLCVCAVQLF